MEDAQIYGHSTCDNGEEDYIELEVIGSNSTISLFHFKNSIPPPQEFEFQMLPSFVDRNTTSSTADELFYNGKLLPLDHIPLHNNSISNKFLHVGKRIVDFGQSCNTPFFQCCNVSRELNQEDYSTDDETSRSSKSLHVSKSFDQSLNTLFCQSCHVSGKLNQEDYSTDDETSRSSKSLHVSKRFDQSLNTPFCQSCHVTGKLNQEEYYSTDDESSSKRSKFHVSKSFDDLKQSFSTPFFQSCHVSRELNDPQDYFFGYSTDDETSKRPKWSLTRKLKLIKQLSFDHSRIKCLINNSVKLASKKEVLGRIHHHSRKSSFSGAIKRLLTRKSSSSTTTTTSISKSSNGNNIQEMHLLMRNMRDVYAEVDPIQAAIAHCKNSHHQQHKLNSLAASKMIFQEQERTGLCRG